MIKILIFKEDIKGVRLGYANVEYYNLIFRNLAVFQKEQRRWVQFPSRKTDDIDERGQEIWMPYMNFTKSEDLKEFVAGFFLSLDRHIENALNSQSEASGSNKPQEMKYGMSNHPNLIREPANESIQKDHNEVPF